MYSWVLAIGNFTNRPGFSGIGYNSASVGPSSPSSLLGFRSFFYLGNGFSLTGHCPSFRFTSCKHQDQCQYISNSLNHTSNSGKFLLFNVKFIPFIPCKPPVWMAKIWVPFLKVSFFIKSKIPKSIFPV